MKIERVWAMPNRWTFTIKPIQELLGEEIIEGLWADPFAGKNSPATIRNDICPDMPAEYHLDALEFLSRLISEGVTVDGVLFDPPYSFTQARMYGRTEYANMGYWAKVKDAIAQIISPQGKAISFGWNTNGIGKNRGFNLVRILIVAHGGSKNDTLVTVEVKNPEALK